MSILECLGSVPGLSRLQLPAHADPGRPRLYLTPTWEIWVEFPNVVRGISK